ncbi:MAG: hypothetical protein HYT70_01530 [Candidatus Aenigmarchaeota archaeon]|nr:hypothetical protein [Candidatus Aenigmarchaeota archaeon]
MVDWNIVRRLFGTEELTYTGEVINRSDTLLPIPDLGGPEFRGFNLAATPTYSGYSYKIIGEDGRVIEVYNARYFPYPIGAKVKIRERTERFLGIPSVTAYIE